MDSTSTEAHTVSLRLFSMLRRRTAGHITLICLFMFIWGVVLGFRSGWNAAALGLVIGAVVASSGSSLFGVMLTDDAKRLAGGSGPRGGFRAFALFLPLAFAAYLLFYRGLWQAAQMLNNFSISALVAHIIFVFVGYRLAYWTWQLSEAGERLRAGKLRVTPSE